VVHACRDCHGPKAGGGVIVEHPLIGRLVARNLTRGKGRLPADWDDRDWLRTLKHGVNRKGKTLLLMPAHETSRIADQDLADIIAYCKSLPPLDERQPGQHLGPLLVATGGQMDRSRFYAYAAHGHHPRRAPLRQHQNALDPHP
jgi:cytochrome c553